MKHKKRIRKLKLLQILAFLLYILFIAVAPVLYAFIRTTTGEITFNFALSWTNTNVIEKGMGLSFTFLLTIALAVLHFWKGLKKFISEAQFGFFKQAVCVFQGAILPGILLSLALYIGSWSKGSEFFIINATFIAIAQCVIRVWQNYLNHILARETRKQEMREVLHERD